MSIKKINKLHLEEKEALQKGDFDLALDLVKQRKEEVKKVLQDNQSDLEKILRLREENRKILAIAKELHKSLKEELKKVHQGNKVFLGYKEANKIKNLYGHYLNKQG